MDKIVADEVHLTSDADGAAISHTDVDLYRDCDTDTHADPNVDGHAYFNANTDIDADLNPVAHANTNMDAGTNLSAIERAISALGVVCAINWLARADVAYDSSWTVAALFSYVLCDSSWWYRDRPFTHSNH